MRSLIAAGSPLVLAAVLVGAAAGPAAAAQRDDGIGNECSSSSRTSSTWVYAVDDEVVSGSYTSEVCKDPAIGWRPYWWENIVNETDDLGSYEQ